MKGIIHNSQTGTIEEYDLPKTEVDERLARRKLQDAKEVEEINLVAQKNQAREALLEKLGITEEEAKLLLS